MTVGYGTLYYSFAIMSEEFTKEFSWSQSFVFGILSLGILFGGLLAPLIGRLLDKHGARSIMSVGSILSAIGLYNLSLVDSKLEYIIALLFLQLVSILILYESAFIAFSQLVGQKARLPIIQVTLIAGFASTIFWPLISYLLTIISWRETYQFLALLHIFIALPIHFFVLKKNLQIDNEHFDEDKFEEIIYLNGLHKKNTFILLTIAFCLIAIPITTLQTQFLSLFKSFGMEASLAITLGALIGPSQVLVRVLEILFSKYITPIHSALFSTMLMSLGLIALLFSGYSFYIALCFILLYGAGQGLSDIVRGTLPLYLFGKNGYGKTTGNINFFRLIITAMVPFCFAYILENFGGVVSTVLLVSSTVIAFILILYINIIYKTHLIQKK
ncbi:MAG: MFS transporter [Arcobacteraceae bacterium]